MSFLDRCCSCHHRLRALGFDYCAIALCIIRKAGLRREIALINSAESQGFGFLFVSVPETDQHKKQKSGERKGGQANQNATNHSCILPLPFSPQIHASKSPRVKKIFSPLRHVTGRLRMPTPLRGLVAARRPPRCALNVAITADYWERRLDDGASSPHYPRFRCGGSDYRRLLASPYPLP